MHWGLSSSHALSSLIQWLLRSTVGCYLCVQGRGAQFISSHVVMRSKLSPLHTIGLTSRINLVGLYHVTSCITPSNRIADFAPPALHLKNLNPAAEQCRCCAGVPGMVGGMLRHMRSLRTMQRECAPDSSPLSDVTCCSCTFYTCLSADMCMHILVLLKQTKTCSA